MKEVESVDRCKWAPERFCTRKFKDFMKEIQRLKTNLRPKMLSQTNTTMRNWNLEVFISPKQLVIDKCYKCACDWLTLKYSWPIVVETDAMSQIDIDNTCYVGDRSCNDGSQREGEGQVNYRDWSEVHQSWRLVAKKMKRICWRSMSF